MTFGFELTYRYHTMDNSNGGGDVSLNISLQVEDGSGKQNLEKVVN